MKLRSGVCTHTVPVPVSSIWPSAKLVKSMSITTNVYIEFEAYCRNLLRTAVTVQNSREVAMYVSQSLINISKISEMRKRYSFLYMMMLQKFYEYEGPEYPFEFVMKLKKAFTPPDKHASKIQRAFRKSRGYAEWAGHPDRLKAQGFFDL